MNAITFDTLKLAQRLRDEVKFPGEQAEKAASVLAETFTDWQGQQGVATKGDILALQNELRSEIRELELRMTIRLGGMIVALGGILIAVRYFG